MIENIKYKILELRCETHNGNSKVFKAHSREHLDRLTFENFDKYKKVVQVIMLR